MTVLLCAGVVVFDELGRVLLTRRADFDVWCLPGGVVDEGESLEEAAIRELAEEAGTVSSLEHLVGVYSEVGGWSDVHIGIFTTHEPLAAGPASAEVQELRWFRPDDLPADMFWWSRQYIADALDGVVGITRRMNLTSRIGPMSREDLYRARDSFDGTPAEFFHHCFPAPSADA